MLTKVIPTNDEDQTHLTDNNHNNNIKFNLQHETLTIEVIVCIGYVRKAITIVLSALHLHITLRTVPKVVSLNI